MHLLCLFKCSFTAYFPCEIEKTLRARPAVKKSFDFYVFQDIYSGLGYFVFLRFFHFAAY